MSYPDNVRELFVLSCTRFLLVSMIGFLFLKVGCAVKNPPSEEPLVVDAGVPEETNNNCNSRGCSRPAILLLLLTKEIDVGGRGSFTLNTKVDDCTQEQGMIYLYENSENILDSDVKFRITKSTVCPFRLHSAYIKADRKGLLLGFEFGETTKSPPTSLKVSVTLSKNDKQILELKEHLLKLKSVRPNGIDCEPLCWFTEETIQVQ